MNQGGDKGTVNCELGKIWCENGKSETVKNCEKLWNCEIGPHWYCELEMEKTVKLWICTTKTVNCEQGLLCKNRVFISLGLASCKFSRAPRDSNPKGTSSFGYISRNLLLGIYKMQREKGPQLAKVLHITHLMILAENCELFVHCW